ncbi:MAG: DUF2442 domain-containing protein [Ignavibacteria bacterium]
MEIKIIKAEFIDNYKIGLEFNDGKKITVDFGSFLKNSANPMTRRYIDLTLFRDFKIVHGDLVWGDYDLCFPIWDLYTGMVEKATASGSV